MAGQTRGLAGGMDYSAVSVAVRRFSQRIAKDAKLCRQLEEMERQMSNVEMRPHWLTPLASRATL